MAGGRTCCCQCLGLFGNIHQDAAGAGEFEGDGDGCKSCGDAVVTVVGSVGLGAPYLPAVNSFSASEFCAHENGDK